MEILLSVEPIIEKSDRQLESKKPQNRLVDI